MNRKRPYYQSYLLRLWRSRHDENAPWRAMLENPHTGERHSFANLESLLTFLRVRSQIKFDKETHPQRFDRYPKSKVKNGQALNDKLENKNLDRSK